MNHNCKSVSVWKWQTPNKWLGQISEYYHEVTGEAVPKQMGLAQKQMMQTE